MSARSAWLVIVAAGRGERLGAGIPKALVPLAGRPIFAYAVESAAASDAFEGIVLVAGDSGVRAASGQLSSRARAVLRAVVDGGERRRDSVRAGLAAVRRAVGELPLADPATLVHDAARPLAPPVVFTEAARRAAASAVVCGRRVADTIKRIEGDRVAGTVPRESLFAAETPQGAPLSWLERAHAGAGPDDASDDAVLLERAGAAVHWVALDVPNFKVTAAADLALADAWVRAGGTPWMGG